jgi:peptidyl-prolyl cis-trans isomerase-like 4
MFPISRYFEAETNPRIKHTKKGLVSMVNCGDNMVGSQFFFTLGAVRCILQGV